MARYLSLKTFEPLPQHLLCHSKKLILSNSSSNMQLRSGLLLPSCATDTVPLNGKRKRPSQTSLPKQKKSTKNQECNGAGEVLHTPLSASMYSHGQQDIYRRDRSQMFAALWNPRYSNRSRCRPTRFRATSILPVSFLDIGNIALFLAIPLWSASP